MNGLVALLGGWSLNKYVVGVIAATLVFNVMVYYVTPTNLGNDVTHYTSSVGGERMSTLRRTRIKKTTPRPKTISTTLPQRVNPEYRRIQEKIHTKGTVLTASKVEQVSCQKLFDKSQEEHRKSRILIGEGKYASKYLADDEISNMTQNCATYITRRRYITESLTELEAQFPLAFSIVTFHDLAMTERLLRAIYRPQNYYCIHVDKKSTSEFYRRIVSLTECFPNVFVSNERADVHWGYIGVLLAEIYCIRDLLKQGMWKYYINLTGEEFPLKTNLQLVKILQLYNGANEISNLPILYHGTRWQFVHTPAEYRTNRTKSPPPHNITIHKGDVHAVISRNFASFVTTNQIAKDFLDWLVDAFCPEELFFASLQFNPFLKAPGAYTGDIGDHYTGTVISRHKIWDFDDNPVCFGCWRKNHCIFGIGDLPSLGQDDHAFFVNKLYRDFEPMAYDCLEELYFNRTYDDYMNPRETNYTFYANQYFVKKHF